MSNLKRFLSKAKAMSRSTLSVVLVLCLLMLMIPTVLLVAAEDVWDGTTIANSFAGGTGTDGDPYLIETGAQLARVFQEVNNGSAKSKHFQLIADIDLAGRPWTPIGNGTNQFAGTFDGDGHTIKGLSVNRTNGPSGNGLFGRSASGALIKNLSLEGDVTINNDNCAAGFVGYVLGSLTIRNCTFTGTVTGTAGATSDIAALGAFVGFVPNTCNVILENCVAVDTTITSNGANKPQGTGGLIGYIRNGADATITGSSFSGTINGIKAVGGLIGHVAAGTAHEQDIGRVAIQNSYSEGQFNSNASNSDDISFGGLVGHVLINNTSKVGPVVLTIEDSYSVATIDQAVNSSGLVGSYNVTGSPEHSSVEIRNSFFAGTAKYPIITGAGTATLVSQMTVKTENVYYQTGSASEESTLTPAGTHQKDKAEFTGGGVLTLLDAGRSVWKQGNDYPIIVTPPKMTNLVIDNGYLDFKADVTQYSVYLDDSATSLTVKPTVETGTFVTVNGNDAGGAEGVKVDLKADTKKTVIEVKIERDGNEKIYTINVFRGAVWNGNTADEFAGGTGTDGDPYLIATGEQLARMAQEVNNGNAKSSHFKLIADISLGSRKWTPIGDGNNQFAGTFDGNGYTIEDLYVNRTGGPSGSGLFGRSASGAVIKNLFLEGNVTIDSDNCAAGFVGYVLGNLTISNCTFTGKVTGDAGSSAIAALGAFVGYAPISCNVILENCVAVDTTITSSGTGKPQGTGGLIGYMKSGADATITGSSFSGTINGIKAIGGLIGHVESGTAHKDDLTKVTIKKSYSEGKFKLNASNSDDISFGGLVGHVLINRTDKPGPVVLTIEDSYSAVTIDQAVNSSGLVGSYNVTGSPEYSSVGIKNSFFAGTAKYPIITSAGTDALVSQMTVTAENVYYQTGSASEESTLTPAETHQKDKAEFMPGGEVLTLLDAGRSVWKQGEDHPIIAFHPKMTDLEAGDGLLDFDENVTDYDIFFENNSATSLTVKPTVELGTTVTVDGKDAGNGNGVTVELKANAATVIKVMIARDGNEKTYTINVFCGSLWDGVTVKPYPNADDADAGTEDNPYKIALPEHLAYMAEQINKGEGKTAHYELVDNIILANKLWTPIGKVVDGVDRPFSGTFNGNGYTIGGLNYFFDMTTDADEDGIIDEFDTYNDTKAPNRSSGGVGLFGVVSGATIKNLNVRGSVVTDQFTAGGLIGRAPGSVTIKNCHFNGMVESGSSDYKSFTGGLIGSVTGDSTITITDSSFTGSVVGDATVWYTYKSDEDNTLTKKEQSPEYIGGFIGRVVKATVYIADSYVNADVSGQRATAIGGMIGGVDAHDGGGFTTVSLERCYTTGSVEGLRVGGLLGWLRDDSPTANGKGAKLTMKNCYSDAELISASTAHSGLISGTRMKGSAEDIVIQMDNCFYAGSGAATPIAYYYPSDNADSSSHWDIALATNGYTPLSYTRNVYYLQGSYSSTANDISNGMTGAEKSADEMKSAAFVDQLNANAGKVVWALGTNHPVLLSFPKLDGIELSHGSIKFSPIVDDYQVLISNKYDTVTVTPTTENPSFIIKVNGKLVVSGQASAAIALAADATTDIKVEVMSGGATMTYTIHASLTDAWDGTYEPFDTSNGAGSDIENPIYINTPAQLAFLSAMVNGEDVMYNGKMYRAPSATSSAMGGRVYKGTYFEITADLIMNDISNYANWGTEAPANDFEPIGYCAEPLAGSRFFGGIINGKEHKIIGLYVNNTAHGAVGGVGLFGSVEGATLRNIHIENSYVTGEQRVGGLVGHPRTEVIMQNCSFSGTVRGTFIHKDHSTQAGGLIGVAVAKVVLNSCWTEGTVSGGNAVGGLIGQMYMNNAAEIKNCYSAMTLDVDDGFTAGGLIGYVTGQAGNLEVYRSHFAGHVPTNTPLIGGKNENAPAVSVAVSNTVYYRADSYEGEVNSALTYDAVEKSVEEFADGTVTDLLNDLFEKGDYWKWETGENGYPVSDGVLLITDYRDYTDDSYYDDGNWYDVFENRPGGKLKNPNSNKGDSDATDDDYTNSETGETSLYIAVLILALISAISAFLLARRKRSVN